MRTLFLLVVLLAGGTVSYSQLTKEQRVQDSVIGWDPKKKYDHYLKPQTTTIGKQKLVHINNMVEWVTKSYTPVGSLGEYIRYVGDYNFGLNLSSWNVGYNYLDEQKHFRPIPEENVPYYFVANRVFGAYDIGFMNKKGEIFFTMQPHGYAPNPTEQKKREGMDMNVDPNVSKYVVWVNEWVSIYLAPGNKLPMLPVSKGELLDKAEAALDGVLADTRKTEAERAQGNKKAEDEAVAYVSKEIDRYRANIIQLREKYKSSLAEQAYIVDMQPTWRSFTADSWDVFKGAPNAIYYPVYKFDAATIEKMKGPQPLWMAVAVPYANKTYGNRNYELYTAITQNLNYDYIYNYFFDPEKIKGKAYTPANAAGLAARLDGYRKKNETNINATTDTKGWAANVHFQEDFSGSPEGAEPANWIFNRFDEHDQVVTLKQYPGRWLKLGYNNRTMPNLIKKPFPKNFTLEFDVVSDDFTSRYGGGVQLYLSTNQSHPNGNEKGSSNSVAIELNLTSGAETEPPSSSNGEVRMKLSKTPEVNEQNYNKGAFFKYGLRDFNNRKTSIHVTLQVNNGIIRLLINNKLAMTSGDMQLAYGNACANCNIPADLSFHYIYWKANQSQTHSYIGNIKVTRN